MRRCPDRLFVRASVVAACLLGATIGGTGLRGAPSALSAEGEADKVNIAELDPKAEAAIESALKYLSKRQAADGSWGDNYRAASTAVVLMAFMLKGHFPERGQYGEILNKGVGYLLARSKEGGGYFGGNMYEHGLATLALSEVWGMTTRKEVRETLKKAVDVILRSQNQQGGWRYEPRPYDADISVTVMQIVALASAKEAGVYVPDKTIERATAYVKLLQHSSGGFGYMGASEPGFARTAAGVMSLLMCGEGKSKAVQRGLEWLMDRPKSVFKRQAGGEFFFYGHYYAIQAMYQAGESYYQKWYPNIRDALVASQGKDGGWTAGEGGADFCTATSVLILGVPYRYLPIYQR